MLAQLIEALLEEAQQPIEVPASRKEQERLYRALVNRRAPKTLSTDLATLERLYLEERLTQLAVMDYRQAYLIQPHIYLWRGDITQLQVDVIVNAANRRMLGCFIPNHRCVDNAIHTFAGMALRLECFQQMQASGRLEPIGSARLTHAYSLPSQAIIHTVAPQVRDSLTPQHEQQLADCYRQSLQLAVQAGYTSIAFCALGTGEFRFPRDKAVHIAVDTVLATLAQVKAQIDVVFVSYTADDEVLYRQKFQTMNALNGVFTTE